MNADQICETFNRCFAESKATLVGGASEPLYEPGEQMSRICFREDYASSALHEIAHWCIAGAHRRRQRDYGYWYQGERDAKQQRSFEAVEVKPQALEWILSIAAGIDFRVSCDNFDERTLDRSTFRVHVRDAAIAWLDQMPPAAAMFTRELVSLTGNDRALNQGTYKELPK